MISSKAWLALLGRLEVTVADKQTAYKTENNRKNWVNGHQCWHSGRTLVSSSQDWGFESCHSCWHQKWERKGRKRIIFFLQNLFRKCWAKLKCLTSRQWSWKNANEPTIKMPYLCDGKVFKADLGCECFQVCNWCETLISHVVRITTLALPVQTDPNNSRQHLLIYWSAKFYVTLMVWASSVFISFFNPCKIWSAIKR